LGLRKSKENGHRAQEGKRSASRPALKPQKEFIMFTKEEGAEEHCRWEPFLYRMCGFLTGWTKSSLKVRQESIVGNQLISLDHADLWSDFPE
jgi:hypothetical protein